MNHLPIRLQPVLTLLTTKGDKPYYPDAPITHLDHALQCATLATQNDATPEMISACLLHDLGCLLDSVEPNDWHEYRSLGILQTLFSAAVTEPIRLHVEAKRYLCQVEPDYYELLSPAARQDLVDKGGIFSLEAVQVFRQKPFANEAIALRRWDEQAQVKDAITPNLEHFIPTLLSCLVNS